MKLKEKYKVYYFITLSILAVFIGPSAFGQVTEDDIEALQADIDQNELDSDNADNQLQVNINSEASDREDQDNVIEAGVGLNTDGTYTANADTTHINDATSVVDATEQLDQAIVDVASDLGGEATARENADNQLQVNINSEASDRADQDDAIEAGVGLNADGSYTADAGMTYIDDATSVVDATEQLDQAIVDVASDLVDETTARENADNQLQTNINTEADDRADQDDAIEAGVGLNADGSYTADAGMTYIDDATSVVDATEQLDQALDNVAGILAGVDDDLVDETTARENADAGLQADIDQNEIDSDAADAGLQADIDQNEIDSDAADTAIASAIGLGLSDDGTGSYVYTANADMNYIQSATTVIEATEQLDQALYEESQARISADNALRASIDQNQSDIEENRKGIAMVAAMTHTTLLPGKDKALDIGVGYFRSETAYSINYAGRLNENVQLNFSAASTSAFKDSAVKCSLGFQW